MQFVFQVIKCLAASMFDKKEMLVRIHQNNSKMKMEMMKVDMKSMKEEDMDMGTYLMMNIGGLLLAAICISFLIPFFVFIISKIVDKVKLHRERKQPAKYKLKPPKLTTVIVKKEKKLKFFHLLRSKDFGLEMRRGSYSV